MVTTQINILIPALPGNNGITAERYYQNYLWFFEN